MDTAGPEAEEGAVTQPEKPSKVPEALEWGTLVPAFAGAFVVYNPLSIVAAGPGGSLV